MGQQITWVAPYKFNQRLPFDVDYKVMGTFMEFYTALMRFVNFKLFSDLGMPYPVVPDQFPVSEVNGTYYDCARVRDMQAYTRKLFGEGQAKNQAIVDKDFEDTPEMQSLNKRQENAQKQKKLFANSVFLLGRETPVYILQHLILSFGGLYILQDELPEDEKDLAKLMKIVTHVCMDRPNAVKEKSKEYIQPQYIVDSLNNLFLLPTKPYTPGIVSKPTSIISSSNPVYLACFSLHHPTCHHLLTMRKSATCPTANVKLMCLPVSRPPNSTNT